MNTTLKRSPRRAPIQTRGEYRVEAILDAAEVLLAEEGYHALTLTEVAARSGSAIGSLYRFFANKEQLIDAVADRIAEHYRSLPATVLDATLATVSIEAFVSGIVEPLATVSIGRPAVAEVMERIIARTASLDREVAARLEAILLCRAPTMAMAERRLVARLMVEIIRAGMRLIARAPKANNRAVIAEVEALLIAYLRLRIG